MLLDGCQRFRNYGLPGMLFLAHVDVSTRIAMVIAPTFLPPMSVRERALQNPLLRCLQGRGRTIKQMTPLRHPLVEPNPHQQAASQAAHFHPTSQMGRIARRGLIHEAERVRETMVPNALLAKAKEGGKRHIVEAGRGRFVRALKVERPRRRPLAGRASARPFLPVGGGRTECRQEWEGGLCLLPPDR